MDLKKEFHKCCPNAGPVKDLTLSSILECILTSLLIITDCYLMIWFLTSVLCDLQPLSLNPWPQICVSQQKASSELAWGRWRAWWWSSSTSWLNHTVSLLIPFTVLVDTISMHLLNAMNCYVLYCKQVLNADTFYGLQSVLFIMSVFSFRSYFFGFKEVCYKRIPHREELLISNPVPIMSLIPFCSTPAFS